MAYGKFAPKMKFPNTYNPYMSQQYNLGYSIGDALGTLWGANYNQRGVEKGEAEARAAAEKYMNSIIGNSQAAPPELYEQYQDVTGNYAPAQKASNVPINTDKQTYIDVTKKYAPTTNNKTMKDMSPERDLKAERQDYVFRKYNSGTPNPDGDANTIDVMSEAAKGNLANMDFSKIPRMNMDDMQSQIRKELRANGRTDYQIDQIMKNITPTLNAKMAEGNENSFGQMYNVLNQQIKNGELDAANMTFAKMSELNPKMAAALQPKMKRAWDANALEQNFQTKFDFYRKDPNLTEREAYNLARYGSVYTPAEQAKLMGVSGRGSRGTGGGSAKGSKSGNDNSDGAQYRWSKHTEADAAAKWAYNILGNDKATPEQRQMATDTLKEVDRFYAKGSYVVPKEEVYGRIKNAIYNETLTPQEAYDWVFDDSGLGDAEKREIGIWIKDNYLDNDSISEEAREGFFGPADNKVKKSNTSNRPSNKPLAQNGTLGQWLAEAGQTWEKAKEEARRRKAV